MIDVRCKGCNKLLAKVVTMIGAVKCPGCRMIFEYRIYSNLHVTTQFDMTIIKSLQNKDASAIK